MQLRQWNYGFQEAQSCAHFFGAVLIIEIRSIDDDTVETNLRCAVSQCGKTVDTGSDGPKAVQHVSCPKHGFLTSFPHRVALGEFVRCLANEILEQNGHRLIDAGAVFILGNEQPRPETMNYARQRSSYPCGFWWTLRVRQDATISVIRICRQLT
jgi:hypothetical protein